MSPAPLRIGNASGFYGDRFAAWQEMLEGGELDVLTGDYLAEITMMILGRDRARDPATGYAKTFLRQMERCLGTAMDRGVRIVTNAGGVHPAGLAMALRELAARLGLTLHIGLVSGDDVTARAAELGLAAGDQPPLTANAYLGAFGIARCLSAGADVVVTGRVTDASLVLGPGIAHFGWSREDYDALAGATLAGHVLECGAQATGGNFSFFTQLPDGAHRPGFPIAELHADGTAVITKHPGTGGAVTIETVTAQLLYEIGPPAYLGPDVVTHFDAIELHDAGPDRVRITGGRGSPPPATLKVGVNALDGFRNTMTFLLSGLDIAEKARLVRAQITERVGPAGLDFELTGLRPEKAPTECALLAVHLNDLDPRRAGRAFSQAVVELALASYPGLTLTAPPGDATPAGVFRAHAVPQGAIEHTATLPDGTEVPIPPPERTAESEPTPTTDGVDHVPSGPTRRVPLGAVVGARSGDKGHDANLGVWARDTASYAWLAGFLTTTRLRELLPELGDLAIERYELPNLHALNVVVRGLLAPGASAWQRLDPQAKALGERLRAVPVDAPRELIRDAPTATRGDTPTDVLEEPR